jgi:hypothetical protein
VYAWMFCCVRCRLARAHTHVSRYPPSKSQVLGYWGCACVSRSSHYMWCRRRHFSFKKACWTRLQISLSVVWFWALCICVLMAPSWSAVWEITLIIMVHVGQCWSYKMKHRVLSQSREYKSVVCAWEKLQW